MKIRRHILAVLLFAMSVIPLQSIRANLIVNEVLANEPGASITLEWFELFNNGATSQNLNFFQVQVGGNVILLDTTSGPVIVRAGDYLVICRNLFTVGNSPGFESVWGNNSGVWGDDALLENYNVIEAGFSLPNSSGIVRVSGFNQSQIGWFSPGIDGTSWERFSPVVDSVLQSIDPVGSTPGRVNSQTPVPFDLALDTVNTRVEMGATLFSFLVRNNGINNVIGGEVNLFYGAVKSDPAESLALTIPLPPTDSGFTTLVSGKLFLSEMYRPFTAKLTGDDRQGNNRRAFVAPGDGYPPAILTEFLANPTGTFTSEWIEILNRQDTIIDLAGWRFGDALTTASIGANAISLTLNPGAYLILARDSAGFLIDYPNFNGQLVEPVSWPTLNNSGDQVRLIDSFAILADAFTYTSAHADNGTWSRDETDTTTASWGRSTLSGGSPGEKNNVRFSQNASGLSVTVSPRIITPDGDGIDDEASIIITAPAALSYTIRMYDRKGRIVRTFENQSSDLASEYRWNGRTEGGRQLPVGIYILYVEAAGVESRKQTIVIGR